mgnify:CR=1 FL=1
MIDDVPGNRVVTATGLDIGLSPGLARGGWRASVGAASESADRHATLWAVRTLACAAIAIVALAACGDDPVESDGPRFCGEAIENRNSLTTPPSSEAEVAATLELYRLMGQLAPVAIAEEWNVVLNSFETAATLVPGDPESEQLVARTAFASEPSAFAVKKWLLENCGLDIPITTIAPQEQIPAVTTTTTVAGDTTASTAETSDE